MSENKATGMVSQGDMILDFKLNGKSVSHRFEMSHRGGRAAAGVLIGYGIDGWVSNPDVLKHPEDYGSNAANLEAFIFGYNSVRGSGSKIGNQVLCLVRDAR